jgi:hypothetical protein
MSVLHLAAAQQYFDQAFSAYGTLGWWPGPYVVCGPTQGGGWIIWGYKVPGMRPDEPVNGIVFKGSNKFLVGDGVGKNRIAALYANAFNNKAAFAGATGFGAGTCPANGAPVNMNVTINPSGLSSNDFIAGNFFIGVTVATSAPDVGDGTFTYGGLDIMVYTGADTPNPSPPVGVPIGTWNNPGSNNNPGKLAGTEQFSSIKYTLSHTDPYSSYFLMNMMIQGAGGGITFASNGTDRVMNIPKGSGNDPTNPFSYTLGALNIAPGVAPGVYQIQSNSNGGTGPFGGAGFFDYTTITVRQPDVSAGVLLTEF